MKFSPHVRIVSNRAAYLAGAAALGLAFPAAASAQQGAEPQTETDADELVLETEQGELAPRENVIIVTASKRETTLQETPISVSVTSGETIEQAQIRDIADLQTVAPSLRVSTLQSSANTNFVIRGFGNGANNAGIEPSVGVFIDNVYRSRSAAQIGDLANVQRIEVLRGPQSTLFGKNASAGVISIITREPQFEFGGSVSATYGNYDQIVLKGDVTGPITDSVAFSVDGTLNKRDGYVEVVNLDETINERDRYSLRGQLLFDNGGALRLRAIGDYSKIDELCCYAGNLVAGPTVPLIFAVGGAIQPEDLFSDRTFLNVLPENEIENYGGSLQADLELGALQLTSITAYRELSSFQQQDVDFSSADIVNELRDQSIDTFTQEVRLTSDFDGPLNFLLGGYYFKEDIVQDSGLTNGEDGRLFFDLLAGAGTPGTLGGIEGLFGFEPGSIFEQGPSTFEFFTLDNESYSIFGTVDFELTDRLTLTGGFNYTDDKKDFTLEQQSLDPLANVSLVDAFISQALGTRDPAQIGAFAAANPAQFQQIALLATNPASNPLLALRPLQFLPPFLNVPNAVEPGQTRDDNFSYTLRAAYDVTDNINTYFSYATGFKASSVNLSRDSRPLPGDFTPYPLSTGAPSGSVILPLILGPSSPITDAGLLVPNLTTGTRFAGPEEAEVYEFGLKAQFDRFGFNLALFDQTLEGFQSNIFTGTGFALANAGSQSSRGFELDATVNPTDPLVLTFAMTYLDAVYDSFVNSAVGDLTGTRPGNVPEFSISTSAAYTHEFGASGNALIARVDYSHESNRQLIEGLPDRIDFTLPDPFLPAREAAEPFRSETNLVNASLTFAMENGLEVGVWARNLLDDRFITQIFPGVAQTGTVSGYPNQPRTYGGTVRFNF
ncbi:TonB-dependent receptor [Qipengyuania atrilutea]|uniref:TonB-dependent receptor n=1 Tax=Qipengyuania atrilutea TaxID=2744473 RepID=A0A850GYX5_9SPHN|nr:TonB-dependent receptor [Actirhodobacter atriluteus]NVD43577.1 TonB-dependent receptor [Actirhodobacter atriluteus]